MTKPIKVRNVVLGEGIPKICVPLTGRTEDVILKQATAIAAMGPDLIEWRVDYFENAADTFSVKALLPELRKILGEIPLLFTFRTCAEGGVQELSVPAYEELALEAVSCGADLIDIELYYSQPVSAAKLIAAIQERGGRVVCSYHHFNETPPEETLLRILHEMDDVGADILKTAVMPLSQEDVLTLLAVTCAFSSVSERPLITMSMGGQGVVSRIGGEVFGSCVTFAAAEEASAPGQLPIEDMKDMLELIHENLI